LGRFTQRIKDSRHDDVVVVLVLLPLGVVLEVQASVLLQRRELIFDHDPFDRWLISQERRNQADLCRVLRTKYLCELYCP